MDKYAEFDASGRYIRNIYHIENDMLPILRVTVTDITKGERTMFSSDEIDISYISSDGISYSLDKDDESHWSLTAEKACLYPLTTERSRPFCGIIP